MRLRTILPYSRQQDLCTVWPPDRIVDIHLLPSSTPLPLNDSEKYGRISFLGIEAIMDSTFALILKDEDHQLFAHQLWATIEHLKYLPEKV